LARSKDFEQQNANTQPPLRAPLRAQLQVWQQQRVALGEDPNDWNAFREHLATIGAPEAAIGAPDEQFEDFRMQEPSAQAARSA
jgi:hypothetical protein